MEVPDIILISTITVTTFYVCYTVFCALHLYALIRHKEGQRTHIIPLALLLILATIVLVTRFVIVSVVDSVVKLESKAHDSYHYRDWFAELEYEIAMHIDNLFVGSMFVFGIFCGIFIPEC
ncbi:hypothetical protein VNI00_016680 [Paramarasmius palmivorus]|uniref:Uncharacterized protein n=1 Tax=Paramarasmius palmivorus TaxID=297713 RepID=A0AAW0BCM9_9AGAR